MSATSRRVANDEGEMASRPPPVATKPTFIVICQRFDGREREFQRYDNRDEAAIVAARLTKVGCPARVAGEELTIEGRDA